MKRFLFKAIFFRLSLLKSFVGQMFTSSKKTSFQGLLLRQGNWVKRKLGLGGAIGGQLLRNSRAFLVN